MIAPRSLRLSGLVQVGERTAGEQAPDHAGARVGGEYDHRNIGRRRIGLQLGERLLSVPILQVQVEQDQVGVCGRRRSRSPSGQSGVWLAPGPCLQVPGDHLDIRRVVLYVEDAEVGTASPTRGRQRLGAGAGAAGAVGCGFEVVARAGA